MKYTKPEITICRFSAEDIITDSTPVAQAFKAANVEVNSAIGIDVSAYLENE